MVQSRKYKVLLVEDHKMFRDGLKSILEMENIAEIIAEAENGAQFLTMLENCQPDLVLMDIQMPVMNGLEATEKALAKYPDLKILVLSMFGEEDYYIRMINAGAKGFILKTSGKRELETSIRTVAEGESYFSNELLRNIITSINKNKTIIDQSTGKELKLTDRETETLKLLCNGFSTVEIAKKLNLSTKSIEAYRSKLLLKTGTKNTVSLVMFAIKHKIITA